MGTRSFIVTPGWQSERFNTAFYRFVELQGCAGVGLDGCCQLRTEPEPGLDREPGLERKVVSLWSEEAIVAFADFWSRYRTVSVAERERREHFVTHL